MKESLLYRVLGIPRTLLDLLAKAEKEGEKVIEVVSEHYQVYETVRSTTHWTDVWVDARYHHGKRERRVFLGRFDSRKEDYSSRETVLHRCKALIKQDGFEARLREEIFLRH